MNYPRKIIIACCILLGGLFIDNTQAQEYTITGTVRTLDDQITGSPIENVKVDADSGTAMTWTDENGNYTLITDNNISNLRFTKEGKICFDENIESMGDDTINVSMPSKIQNVSMGTDTISVEKFLEMYQPSGRGYDIRYWKNLPIRVALNNANSTDTTKAVQVMGFGNWTTTDTNSIAYRMKRDMFTLADSTTAADSGITIYFHSDGNYTNVYSGDESGMIQFARCHVRDPTPTKLVKHEIGRAVVTP
ncbi:MAG: carboxypeptidase regulatory-like domain-containing protein [Ignavibacteriae bacterium]|nr:carboxypeptidase regulatory-like domain-containing protein [Ignavibacteriota bacterium]